ncbi:hypothetical protein MXB_5011 [Myxobolus squamalis]|nr:hypothetical protein MXB_5011 [Myxobolus squamalis]
MLKLSDKITWLFMQDDTEQQEQPWPPFISIFTPHITCSEKNKYKISKSHHCFNIVEYKNINMATEQKNIYHSDLKSQQPVSGKIHDDIKKYMDKGVAREPAWESLTTQPGLSVWRVNKFKLEPIKDLNHGVFYEGDSYIVLHTYLSTSQSLKYDVFMWIGNHSSADEYGTAAYKMAELDVVVLNDQAIQHRECQSSESLKFMTLFKKVTILKGGCDTGFKSGAKEKEEPKLFHISGDKKCIKEEQISFRRNNITEDDVFIIDLGEKVYQTKEDTQKREKSLWKLSDASGKMEISKVASGEFSKSLLCSKDVFIFDTVDTIYVWVGKETSKDEKMYALSYAQKYADSISKPKLALVKVAEGNETEKMMSQIK